MLLVVINWVFLLARFEFEFMLYIKKNVCGLLINTM